MHNKWVKQKATTHNNIDSVVHMGGDYGCQAQESSDPNNKLDAVDAPVISCALIVAAESPSRIVSVQVFLSVNRSGLTCEKRGKTA